jgi:pyruvate, water dikinase
MNRIIHFFRTRFGRLDSEEDARKLEEFRLEFKVRFHSFKLLLQANNEALENMAAIEKALADREPFGMPFIKARSTAAAVSVYRMILNLDEVAPGKYAKGLKEQFTKIQGAIAPTLSAEKPMADDRLVIPFSDIFRTDAERVGSKMAKLCDAKNRLNMNVPDGFVIAFAAYQRFLTHNDLQVEINRRFQMADFSDMTSLQQVTTEIKQLVMEADIPPDVEEAIYGGVNRLEKRIGKPFGVALRSSAMGEDLVRTSFAGQYLTRLNVSRPHILQAYKEVVASKYSLQAVMYRYNCGLRDEELFMCVGCMQMVDAEAGGVIYTRDPLNEKNEAIVINSSWGSPLTVVEGSSGCDHLSLSRSMPHQLIDYKIEAKERTAICAEQGGLNYLDTDESILSQPSLKPEHAVTLAEWAMQLEAHFGSPQDIEWALSRDGELSILQCRPLRQMEKEIRVHDGDPDKGPADQLICQGGISVSTGSGSGPVFMVEKTSDMLNFPPGSVLVTRLALPGWALLLDRAAAIVTERGSFAGHLGNVAREFGVPAIFGVSDAQSLLKDEGQVTVDANQTTIFRGKIESLLTHSEAKKNLIKGSPVYETLSVASRYIVPLNLLDPRSPDFRPSKCETLHDITRFIHEKSVQEIFNFGREFNFSEKASKQLVYKVPMHWWILNLDDGFSEEVKGKTVQLDEICSIPMLAIWDGIIAVPWDGPPPIDSRGLMSVMFQATVNQAINESGRSRIATKNYFMISRHFCSLTIRLGFHFTTVESIVGEDDNENYICFQYRGGAADHRRRLRRVRFLGDILEENGFVANINEDTLVARIDKREQETMITKLKIIGYITIHSRQLDMIMSNGSSVNYYREKFRRDIAGLSTPKNIEDNAHLNQALPHVDD